MNTSRILMSVAAGLAVVAMAGAATAQAPAAGASAPSAVPTRMQSVLACPLVDKPPALDGKLDDEAWKKAQPLRQWSFRSVGVRYQTEAWLCRDADNLYIGARCFDDNLGELVTKNSGDQLWRNDCLEIYIVPDKKADLFSHLIVDCAGKSSGGVWGLDKWHEPVESKGLDLKVKTGREANAWTAEIAIPLKPFNMPIKGMSIWAFGLCREKHSYPEEISSFQGGFNRPEEYPDLVFDDRTLVFDGIGVKNIGKANEAFRLNIAVDGKGMDVLRPFVAGHNARVLLNELGVFGKAEPNQEVAVTILKPDGSPLAKEVYRMVPAPKPVAKIDLKALPEAKFRPGPMDDPKFFPVGVWLQPAGKAYLQTLKGLGVNVMYAGVDAYPNPKDKGYLDALQAEGMYAIIPFKPEYVEKEIYKHPAVIGWMHGDEPDQPKAGGETATADELMADYLKMRAPQPGLPVFMNLGQGVANDRYGARVAYDKYPAYCKAADAISYDIYPCNSLGATGPERLCTVAKGVERLVQWTEGKKPIWFIIECNRFTKEIEKDSRAPTAEEFKTQTWMAITAGARGITLFCHTWYKKDNVTGIDPELMPAIKATFAEVHSLAEVINSPTVEGGATAQCSPGGLIGVLAKKQGGATYVLAVNMFKKAEKAVIVVKDAPDGTAEVLFENRTVPVKGGQIADDFAPYAVHRYKIGK